MIKFPSWVAQKIRIIRLYLFIRKGVRDYDRLKGTKQKMPSLLKLLLGERKPVKYKP
jgi:hypothetical protein